MDSFSFDRRDAYDFVYKELKRLETKGDYDGYFKNSQGYSKRNWKT